MIAKFFCSLLVELQSPRQLPFQDKFMARMNTNSKLERNSFKKCSPRVFKKKNYRQTCFKQQILSHAFKLLALTNLFRKIWIADPHHVDADPDPDPAFLSRIQIRIRILFKVMGICDSPELHFEPPCLHCERPRPYTALC
jgi:hypothetical protein